MNFSKKCICHVFLALFSMVSGWPISASGNSPWPENRHWPKSCDLASRKAIASQIREFADQAVLCLSEPELSQTARVQMLELLKNVYERESGRIPGNFLLPDGVKELSLGQRFNDNRQIKFYVVEIEGKVAPGETIEELKLISPEGVVALDRTKATPSTWSFAGTQFGLKQYMSAPLPEGLYKVVIKTPGGVRLEQRVPIVDWAAEQTPEIIFPSPGESIGAGRLQTKWRLPASRSEGFEERRLLFEVMLDYGPHEPSQSIWILAASDKMGPLPNASNPELKPPNLARGRYLELLTYYEDRYFGSLKVMKATNIRHPFYVH